MEVESAVNEALAQATKSSADATKLLFAEAEELGDIEFEDESFLSNVAQGEDDYLPHAGSDPPHSTFDDLKRGVVDVTYTHANVKHTIVGVHLNDSTSVYEQVAIDLARHMRWGDVVEAQFAQGGALPLFYNRVESIAKTHPARTQAIVGTISNAQIVPPSYVFPWQNGTNFITRGVVENVDGFDSRVDNDASLGMKQCRKRRAESAEDSPSKMKSPKRAKVHEDEISSNSPSNSPNSSPTWSDNEVKVNEPAKQVQVAMSKNHRTCAYATGTGPQNTEDMGASSEAGGYEPSSPKYTPTDPGGYEPSSPKYSSTDPLYSWDDDEPATFPTTTPTDKDPTMLPEDIKSVLLERAVYGHSGYVSSQGSKRARVKE